MPAGCDGGMAISLPEPTMVPLEVAHVFVKWTGRGCRLISDGRLVRAIIDEDGAILDGAGVPLAFIEANGEVGDANMSFVGRADESQVTLHNAHHP